MIASAPIDAPYLARMHRLLSTGMLCALLLPVTAQDSALLAKLLRNSYRVFELQRNYVGVYRDAKTFSGPDFHPASISNTGMGLVALCVADATGWEANAEALALLTLRSVTGHHPTFSPDRNAAGFFRHWLDMTTGAQAWGSEYSTIDTEILVAGALFCKRYFDSDSIAHYADVLWASIDHASMIDDPIAGSIFREQDGAGIGVPGSQTLPYNEYMIAAWMARNADTASAGPARQLWDLHYRDPVGLPRHLYGGFDLLTDQPACLSSFVHPFNFFLCHPFATSADYGHSFDEARRADSLWWASAAIGQSFEWGLGAGSANFGSGYHADRIGDNPGAIVSPHIVAGFLPVYPGGAADLVAMWNDGAAAYALPVPSNDSILWRHSLTDTVWRAGAVQGIDFSTMLFGLASLPEFLGVDFFIEGNDFFREPGASGPGKFPAAEIRDLSGVPFLRNGDARPRVHIRARTP